MVHVAGRGILLKRLLVTIQWTFLGKGTRDIKSVEGVFLLHNCGSWVQRGNRKTKIRRLDLKWYLQDVLSHLFGESQNL